MLPCSFDNYASEYRTDVQDAVGFSGQDAEVFTRIKVQHLLAQAQRHLGPLEGLSILDVGCGIGVTNRYLIDVCGRVAGVDVSAESIRMAARTNPRGDYHYYDGTTLPFENGVFDLAFAICVVHHVRPPEWQRFVKEMERVVRPGGLVLIFEHNPWNPLTRLVVSRCIFDRDAVLLPMSRAQVLLQRAGLQTIERRFILFTPWVNSFWRFFEKILGWLPLGAQYMIVARRPEQAAPARAA